MIWPSCFHQGLVTSTPYMWLSKLERMKQIGILKSCWKLYIRICMTLRWCRWKPPISFFCSTRWIDGEKVAIGTVGIWKSKSQICNFYQSLPKITMFFIAGTMKPFLTQYQSIKSMKPYLYDGFYQLLRHTAPKSIKLDVLKQYKNSSNLCDIDLTDPKNRLTNRKLALAL